MAGYTINHICGHSEEVQIYGPEKDRPHKREWMASQMCLDCKRETESLSAEAWAQAHNLVSLFGSDKQIAWANKIRREIVEEVEVHLQGIYQSIQEGKMIDSSGKLDYYERGYQLLLAQSQAKYWIDSRTVAYSTLWQRMVEICKKNDAKAEQEVR